MGELTPDLGFGLLCEMADEGRSLSVPANAEALR